MNYRPVNFIHLRWPKFELNSVKKEAKYLLKEVDMSFNEVILLVLPALMILVGNDIKP